MSIFCLHKFGPISAALFLLLFALPSWAKPLTILTEDFPPYNFERDGKARGLSSEVVQAVLKEIGLQASIIFLPWKRAYLTVQSNENFMIYSIARIPERENMFHWVGPVAPYKTSFYKLKSNKTVHVNSLEDAKEYKVGVASADVIEIYLKRMGFRSFSRVHDDRLNIRMLAQGHIDLIAYDEASFLHVVKNEGLNPSRFERLFRLEDISDNLYLAFNKNSKPELVQKFITGLETIREKGIIDQIHAKYLRLEK